MIVGPAFWQSPRGGTPTDPHWGNVLLLMNAASTNTTDASGNQTLSVTGSVPINSTQTLFGANTYRIAAGNNRIVVANPAFFCAPADAQEWTVEGWAYIESAVATGDIVQSTPFYVDRDQVSCTNLGLSSYSASGTDIALNQWVHWAMVRDNSPGGSNCRLRRYIDGVQDGVSLTFSIGDQVTNTASFGYVMGNDSGQQAIGSFCHFRWTMGVCRYPSGTTFSVPTTAFPTS